MFLSRGNLRGAVPRQEVVDSVDRMIGDVGEHMAQPGFGLDTTQLGGADLRPGHVYQTVVLIDRRHHSFVRATCSRSDK